jgi:hypothetical protein
MNIFQMFYNKKNNFEDAVRHLETGDIILYQTRFWYSRLIEYVSKCNYSHISIVLKNPTWLDPELKEEFYLLESGAEVFPDAVSGKKKFGVQIVPLKTVFNEYQNQNYGHLYFRKLQSEIPVELMQHKIKEAFEKVKKATYDINPCDWLAAVADLNKPLNEINGYEKTNCFWCSALTAFVFMKIGYLEENIPWTIISPSDFSCGHSRLTFLNCKLENEKLLV